MRHRLLLLLGFALLLHSAAICPSQLSAPLSGTLDGDFQGISVGGNISVMLYKGKPRVETDSELIEYAIQDGTLTMRIKPGKKARKIQIAKVYCSELRQISVSASADIEGQDRFSGSDLSIAASSAGDLALQISLSGTATVTVSSGADVELSGEAAEANIVASSGADFDGEDFVIKGDARATASSGADISLHVNGQLDAVASSGADIRYTGKPSKVNASKSSGAAIDAF